MAQITSGSLTIVDVTDGAPGLNNTTVFLYRRAASAPNKPTGNLTYTFSTASITGALEGWVQSINELTGSNPIWMIAAVASSNGETDVIESSEWAGPIKMAQNGQDGQPGSQGASVATTRELYYLKTNSTNPAQITNANQIHTTDDVNQWTSVVPTYIGSGKYYICIETTLSNGNVVWSAPVENKGLTDANVNVANAIEIARGVKQHFFWVATDRSENIPAGAYIAEESEESFYSSPTKGNILTRSDGIWIRNGVDKLATLQGSGLTFLVPTGTYKGQKSVSLNGSGLTFYNIGSSNSAAATLASDGLQIENGSIILGGHGTSGVNAGDVALSNKNFTRSINGTSHNDLRFAVGSKFGVASDGTLYATGGVFNNYSTTTEMNTVIGNAVDGIEVGGRNLLENSIDGNAYSYSMNGGAVSKVIDSNGATFTITTLPLEGSWGVFMHNDQSLRKKIEADTYYTLSFDMKVTANVSGWITFNIRQGNGANPYLDELVTGSLPTTPNVWKHIEITNKSFATLPAETSQGLYLSMPALKAALGSFSIKNIKVEKGNKATDWSPSPQDVQAEIDGIDVGGRNRYSYSSTSLWTYKVSAAKDASINGITATRGATDDVGGVVRLQHVIDDVNSEWTVSFDVKGTGSGKVYADICDTQIDITKYPRINISSDYQHYVGCVKPAQVTSVYDFVDINADATVTALTIKNIKVEKGNKATDWTPAPEDVQSEIDAKKSVHTVTGAGSDASASYATILSYNERTLTYIVDSSAGIKIGDTVRIKILVSDFTGTPPVYIVGTVTAIPSSTKVTMLAHGIDTTIIDGGNILTNSIGANKIKVGEINIGAAQITSGTIDNARIPNLSADKITSGTINIGRIPEDALNSNIQVGGKNLVRAPSSSTVTINGLTFTYNPDNGYITVTGTNTKTDAAYVAYHFSKSESNLKVTANQQYTYTIEGNMPSVLYAQINGLNTSGGAYGVFRTEGKGSTVSNVITVPSNHNSSAALNSFFIGVMPSARAVNCSFRIKLEIGNKKTDWTPAPEDLDNYITRIDNNGIRVHPYSTENNSVVINASGMEVFKGGTAAANSVAFYGDTARIGKTNANRFLMNASSLQAYDSSGTKYFEVSASGLTYGTNTAATTTQVSTAQSTANNAATAASNAATAASNAAKTATTYITDIDSNLGITVKPATKTGNDYLQMNSTDIRFVRNNVDVMNLTDSVFRIGTASGKHSTVDTNGLHIWIGAESTAANEVASFGSTVRIGKASSKHISIDATNGMQVFTGTESDSTNIAQFGSYYRIGIKNKARFLINSDSLQAYDVSNNKYFEITNGGMSANLITAGKLTSKNGMVYFDLDNNEIACSKLVSPKHWDSTTAEVHPTIVDIGFPSSPSAGSYDAYCNFYDPSYISNAIGIYPFHGSYSRRYGIISRARDLRLFALPGTVADQCEVIIGQGGFFVLAAGGNTFEFYVDEDDAMIAVPLKVVGTFTATGTKSRLVETDNYQDRLLYCYETPTPLFGDIGEAILDEDGICYVDIDDIFSETIASKVEYQVFLQKEDSGDCWVADKQPHFFVIKGTPGLKVAWELKAKQKGYETQRLEQYSLDLDEYENTHEENALIDPDMVE